MEQNNLKKRLQKTFIFITAITIGFTGCKKDNLDLKTESPINEITIEDGRLVFSEKAFTELMTVAHKKASPELIDEVISKLPGNQNFISLEQESINFGKAGKLSTISLKNVTQMSIKPDRPSDSEEPELPYPIRTYNMVEDPYFTRVLNTAGEIEVEQTLYKLTDYGTFMAESRYKKDLDSYINTVSNVINLSSNFAKEDGDLYKLRWNPNIFFIDSYGYAGGPTNTTAGTPPTSTIIDFASEPNNLFNIDVYEFNDAQTWAGKFLQQLFGRDHFKSYSRTSKARLKANFYSTNWGVFASVGVRSVIQTRGWTGLYRPFENFDEMRLGWSNVVMNVDLPPMKPFVSGPGDFWGTSSKALQSEINFNFKGIEQDFLVYRLDQIIAFDQVTNTLPFDLKTKLNTLITKLNGTEINVAKMLESGLDKQAVDRLVKYIKAVALDKNKGVALTNSKGNPSANTIGKIIIPQNWDTKYDNPDNNAVMTNTFDFNTMKIGMKNGKPFIELAKSIKIDNAEIIALGKLNGEWAGISIIKK